MRHLGSAEKECEDLHLASSSSTSSRRSEDEQGDKGGLCDKDRPRFTLPELKDILQERNSLKARVSDLEDELAMYRPKSSER